MPQGGNYHQHNHKVLYTTIIKDKQGGYSYKMGISCYQLHKDKDYTLCIKILNPVAGFTVQKFSHRYTNSDGNVEYMYYIKIIVNFEKTTKKLTLQTNGLRDGSTNETSITLLNSFNGKRVVFWLTKKGTGGDLTVKASISNYSGTLTLSSALASQSTYTFRIFSEDATVYQIMYTPNFYDLDSLEFHRIMLQEKLNGSYVL